MNTSEEFKAELEKNSERSKAKIEVKLVLNSRNLKKSEELKEQLTTKLDETD